MQRRAQQKLTKEKLSQKIERIKKNFLALHPLSAMREDGVKLLDEIEGILEIDAENESIKAIEATKSEIQNLRRDYKLETEMNKAIDDYLGFLKGLERVKYAEPQVSQEENLEEDPLQELLGGSSEETQFDEAAVDGKVQTDNEQDLVEPTVITDNSIRNDIRKKPNQRK